ncbi:F-box/kelch-repeat protein At3g23880-like [Salvia miltiorrhiza]|uniref:F-box/kelch-repeat protein At3g23880-like n=1 Tax=Salvia miltiorrhiza TaxID=226208 RepID=UPI0025AD2C60|nr:F-box/kelch-repeat protein At3g23880-like [Salvia miltiorrhiza]
MEETNDQSRNTKIRRKSHHLPEEIIAEILARLPVRSLLRFRCVSQSWRRLISSRHFCDAHLQISSKDPNFSRRRAIATVLLPFYTLKQCSLHSLLLGPAADAADLDYPMKNPRNSIRVVGCCNGLVCIAVNGKHFFLWNPSTKRHKKLADADDRMKSGLFITKYGFGFDETNDDYKVLGILSGFCNSGRYESVVKIYSLRRDSWKVIDAFKDGLPFDDNGKFVSGKLHWGRRFGMESKWDIVCLDLGSESCVSVNQPSYLDGGFIPSLGVIWGSLCVMCDFPKVSVDVWVLKDSWMKLVVLPYFDDPWKGPYSTPLCIGGKGEILLVYGSAFIVYNPKQASFRRPKITNIGTFLEADVYVESLVPLDGY